MDTLLPVNELFETIQGEATYTGTPAIFVRMQGCDVGCPWCDTKHTWKIDPLKKVGTDEIINKTKDADTYGLFTPGHLVDIIELHKAKHIVITGGEPCVHDLWPLTCQLINRGYTVQIETSGTSEIKIAGGTFVTLSPKIAMPGGLTVRRDSVARADEIKMPVGKMADVDNLKAFLSSHNTKSRCPTIWLQPLSQSEKATALCVEQATINGWKISLQVHKYLGVR